MGKLKLSFHAGRYVDDYYSIFLDRKKVEEIVNDKMKHRKEGEHWIVLCKMETEVWLERLTDLVNGDMLVAVVTDRTGKWEITTVMLRREAQYINCSYYWE